MIKLYSNPWMTDFLRVVSLMPDDERQQVEAFTGEPFNMDAIAVNNFTVPGPKWVVKNEAMEPLVVGGFVPQRPGVLRDFMITTPDAWKHGLALTRICKGAIDAMLESGAHRVECVVPVVRVQARPEIQRWYSAVGYQKEGILQRYLANGGDAEIWARVRD